VRTNIVLDDNVVEEAMALTGIRTKREVVHLALTELIRLRKKKDLASLAGRIRFAGGFDHKAMRELRRGPG
jgi:Arc/MetJ family transcription regulator